MGILKYNSDNQSVQDFITYSALTPLFIGLLIILVWLVKMWGFYRQLNGLSRIKSFLAFSVFCLFQLIVSICVVLIQKATLPTL